MRFEIERAGKSYMSTWIARDFFVAVKTCADTIKKKKKNKLLPVHGAVKRVLGESRGNNLPLLK